MNSRAFLCLAALLFSGALSFAQSPALPDGSVQIYKSGSFGNRTGFGVDNSGGPTRLMIPLDSTLTGPNTYVDVRQFGARAVTSPQQTTATVSMNGTSVSLGAAWTGQNGDGITIAGAGAKLGLGTVSAPIVVAAQPSGPMNVGQLVVGSTGSTKASYQTFFRDLGGGYTAASATTTIRNGLALGNQTASIAGCTRAGITASCTIAANTINSGAQFHIVMSNTGDASWNGSFIATSANGATTLTWTQGQDSRSGAPSSSVGGGTVTWHQTNKITLTAPTGTWWQGFVCTGDGRILPARPGQLVVEDYGATISPTPALPWDFQSSCPSAVVNDRLVTTITSGAGTASVIIATPANKGVTSSPARFDDAPTIKAAAIAASHSRILELAALSSGSYVTSSVLDLSPYTLTIKLNGAITAGDTIRLNNTANLLGDSSQLQSHQFTWASQASIACSGAWPCLQMKNNEGGPTLRNLEINDLSNNALAVQMGGTSDGSGGFNQIWDNITIVVGAQNGADYTGLAVDIESGVTNEHFSHVLFFASSPSQNPTATTAPLVLTNSPGGGNDFFCDFCYWNQRGMSQVANPVNGLASIILSRNYRQGGIQPLIALEDGNRSDQIKLEWFNDDTCATNLIANYASTINKNVKINGISGCTTSTGMLFTGLPLQSVIDLDGSALSGQLRDTSALGLSSSAVKPPAPWNTSVVGPSNAYAQLAEHLVFPDSHSMVWTLSPPAGLAGALTSGGTLPLNTAVCRTVSAHGADGGETAVSPQVCVTPTARGTQAINWTWTAEAGAVSYNIYQAGGGANSVAINLTTASYTDIGSGYNASQQAPAVTMTGLTTVNASGMYAPRAVLTTALNGNRVSFTGTFVLGSNTANRTYTLPDASATLTITIASGTATLGTTAIASNTCASPVTARASAVLATDSISWSFNADPNGVTGYGAGSTGPLSIWAYPTAGNVNFRVCNLTGGSITPGAATLNWRVVR